MFTKVIRPNLCACEGGGMNSRAIIVLTVLLVFGWAGAALAGEVCDKLPTAPGARAHC
jgi:hypothetical protein